MLYEIILFSLLAGSTVFIGGLISYYFESRVHNKELKELIIHYLIAFSTGVMLSAISFVLVPDGMLELPVLLSTSLFILGGLSFFFFDKLIEKNRYKIPQVIAMLLDFIPESIALGAVFVYNHNVGILLSIFIALQNLPESFNSYTELKNLKHSSYKALFILFILSFVGLIFSLLGYVFLDDKILITSSLMLFSAGGIMYIIFQDIAPLLEYKKRKLIAIGVNFGFIIGMLGESII
ncbi:ZIP family metal transporter [Arcobacter nitrofigilis DSM 7299]|uniref:ZIP family metal transporter n=1 Tax=Arcobacter nitrofigilis (strain ATCC 33309 / DSM 7299 / CCUG 15893 / LMG 7604 / NCTC 12251 / CI) TaxID=572480 RepID=D5V0H6_ARCNC|nr:divalent cation transporter [Arcobacter nitrofigilis]ADG93788.1 ZIP family metal transporter [Arcobacter nitrofigilis DSM 7299]